MKHPVLKENMTKSLVCVPWNAPIRRAYNIMEERRIRHLPVIDAEGFIIGILSDRDVKLAMDPQSQKFRKGMLVGDFMSWPTVKVDETTPIHDIAEGMVDEKLSAFLVTRGDEVVGIVTAEDLLALLAKILKEEERPGAKLSDILFQPVVQEAIRELESAGV